MIAEENGEFTGWLRFNLFWDNTQFMNMLFVIESHSGKGIGRQLVTRWESEMKSPSSLLLALVQRATYISFNNSRQLSKKIGRPIAVGGEFGQLTTINCLTDFYLVNEMFIPSSHYWSIGVGVQKGDIETDEKGKSYVVRFAQNLAWAMKKLGD